MMILNTKKRSQQDSDRIIWAFGFKEKDQKYSSSRICTTNFLQSGIQIVKTEKSPICAGLWQDNIFCLQPLDRDELLFLDVSYATEFSWLRHNNGKSAGQIDIRIDWLYKDGRI